LGAFFLPKVLSFIDIVITMKLGFIGTGKIASSVITGICKSKINFIKILISPRNKIISKKLKKKFKKINIAKDNQEIVDNCNWIFLSITPTVGKKIIKKLKFKSSQTIISFISTFTLTQLKRAIKVKATIVRAIPLPPISLKKGPVPIYPPNKKVKFFFNKIGTTVEINNEKSSINFWSTSGMMAPFYELLRVMTDWLVKRGVKRDNAQKYITSLFLALSEDAVVNSKKDLKYLVKESQTPKGLNEQGVKELTKAGFYRSLEKTLNSIHKRLNK
jgi:pyrroline-5-carboxylate reductase